MKNSSDDIHSHTKEVLANRITDLKARLEATEELIKTIYTLQNPDAVLPVLQGETSESAKNYITNYARYKNSTLSSLESREVMLSEIDKLPLGSLTILERNVSDYERGFEEALKRVVIDCTSEFIENTYSIKTIESIGVILNKRSALHLNERQILDFTKLRELIVDFYNLYLSFVDNQQTTSDRYQQLAKEFLNQFIEKYKAFALSYSTSFNSVESQTAKNKILDSLRIASQNADYNFRAKVKKHSDNLGSPGEFARKILLEKEESKLTRAQQTKQRLREKVKQQRADRDAQKATDVERAEMARNAVEEAKVKEEAEAKAKEETKKRNIANRVENSQKLLRNRVAYSDYTQNASPNDGIRRQTPACIPGYVEEPAAAPVVDTPPKIERFYHGNLGLVKIGKKVTAFIIGENINNPAEVTHFQSKLENYIHLYEFAAASTNIELLDGFTGVYALRTNSDARLLGKAEAHTPYELSLLIDSMKMEPEVKTQASGMLDSHSEIEIVYFDKICKKHNAINSTAATKNNIILNSIISELVISDTATPQPVAAPAPAPGTHVDKVTQPGKGKGRRK